MFKVDLDVRALKQYAGKLTNDVLEQTVNDLSSFAQDRLMQIASDKLSAASVQRYAAGIQVTKTPSNVTISLEGETPLAFEQGTSGFDIKPGLLSSPKAKQGASGPYVDVPLPLEKQGLTKPARKTLKKAVMEARRTGESQRVKNAAMDTVVTPKGEAINFRRVSKKSDSSSWIYPSRPGIEAFDTVAKEINDLAPQMMADIFEKLSGGGK